jgi:hypothetical protein
MIDLVLALIAAAAGSGGGATPSAQPGGFATDESASAATAPAAAPQYVAEPQTPTGKFTTATEIRPIMSATRGNWVAVREYDGNDLIYVTQILSWRCGLVGLRVGLNGGPLQDWPLPPCQIDTNAPNAIPADAKIYETHGLGSIQSVTVEIIYDDLATDSASFERKEVLMP